MEMGIGFLVGAMVGAAASIIVAVIVAISRKAVGKHHKTRVMGQDEFPQPHGAQNGAQNGPVPKSATAIVPKEGLAAPRGSRQTSASVRTSSGNTMVVGKVDSSEKKLDKNLKDVRELLLRLADVVSATETASGNATLAFNSARDVIGKIDSESSDLQEAQRVLIDEIDRVIKTNAKLHTELNNANQGIAEQRRQIEELRVQARIDALTKIANRAAFDERLNEYLALVERGKLAFSLLLLDIDLFKAINDEHGHIAGDRVLRGVAARISASIRANDFAARYGGEEFVVIMPATDLTESATVAERVRQDIAKTNFRLDDKNIKITISGGLAECRVGQSCETIIAAADQALYHAKTTGRNRVVVNNQ